MGRRQIGCEVVFVFHNNKRRGYLDQKICTIFRIYRELSTIYGLTSQILIEICVPCDHRQTIDCYLEM